jgi:hypothetical protein
MQSSRGTFAVTSAAALAAPLWAKDFGPFPAVVTYTTNGDYAIINNTAEKVMMPFAIERKTRLFFGSDRGAMALVIPASFTDT